MNRRLILAVTLALSACVPVTEAPTTPTRAAPADLPLPEMKTFANVLPPQTRRSNQDIARDFLDLSFRMESGRELPILTRFEGPVTVRVSGNAPPYLNTDLNRLLTRLRNEADIDISRTSNRQANITVHAVSRQDILNVLPQTACFVAPNVASLDDYRSARRQARTDWTQLNRRDQLAIFVPNDASPQEVRDCLHEELAQSLGPLNDLYRLPNSVFNDDNVHSVLTSFDMLILQATYSPDLRSGMSRADVAARLPGLLARLNPVGQVPSGPQFSATPPAWGNAIVRALGPGTSASRRRGAADQAVRIASSEGWQDHRRGFAHFARGRLTSRSNPEKALREYVIADSYYARSPEARLYSADVSQHLASYAISEGKGAQALQIIDANIDIAMQAENAMLLATLLMLRAEALEQVGRGSEARAVRLDSLGWARYGFGPDWAVWAKLQNVASLSPQKTPA
jgi:hypothetical protein